MGLAQPYRNTVGARPLRWLVTLYGVHAPPAAPSVGASTPAIALQGGTHREMFTPDQRLPGLMAEVDITGVAAGRWQRP